MLCASLLVVSKMDCHFESSLHHDSEIDNTYNPETQLLNPRAGPECAHSDASSPMQLAQVLYILMSDNVLGLEK
jgi:hypothetical protein